MEIRPTKQLIFGDDVRRKIMEGITPVYEAVATTLSSKGRNVSLEKNWGAPVVVHDGVTVARDIVLRDPFANQAAQLVIKAAQAANKEAGDGTTTTTILAYAIAKEGIRLVTAGSNPMVLRKGIDKAVAEVMEQLAVNAEPVETAEKLQQVAAISAASPEIGDKVADAVRQVGTAGVVTVQDGSRIGVNVEFKQGLEFDRGWININLITNADRLEAQLADVRLVLVDQKLNIQEALKLLEPLYDEKRGGKKSTQTLVIAHDYDVDTIGMLVSTRRQAGYLLCAVKAPDFGEHRTGFLQDMAVLTGGTVIGGATGIPLDTVQIQEHAGSAKQAIVTQYQTIVVDGAGKEEDRAARAGALDVQLAETKDYGMREKLINRKAKLTAGVAVVEVGAASDEEQREVKERVIDAVNATQAAREEGIVPGGGVALVKARQAIAVDTEGANLVYRALLYPLMKLMTNSGVENSGWIVGKIEGASEKNYGYNVDTEEFGDLVDMGVIDPVKVTRSALKHAASVAIMLLTMEAMIAYERDEGGKENAPEGVQEF